MEEITLNDFVKCLKQTGSITRKSGSGRPRTANGHQHQCCWPTGVEPKRKWLWACVCAKGHHFEHLL